MGQLQNKILKYSKETNLLNPNRWKCNCHSHNKNDLQNKLNFEVYDTKTILASENSKMWSAFQLVFSNK